METASLGAAVSLFDSGMRCAPPAARMPAAPETRPRSSAACRASVRADAEGGAQFTSPKAGAVGEARFQQNASPGTYWSTALAPTTSAPEAGTRVRVEFDTGSQVLSVEGVVGENLLRLAERVGALSPTEEYCFEGTCCHCEMEVEGGATEVGYRAYASSGDLVRSCICPVPSQEVVKVRILSEEGAWSDGVL